MKTNTIQQMLFKEFESGAEFSPDRKYRYALWRIWDKSNPLIMFIGLNPSKANELKDDPTIRRVRRFAFDWGYGGVYMMNPFAFVTAYPDKLFQCADPLGDNDKWLIEISKKCNRIICAWGNFKVKERDREVRRMFSLAYCLGKNKNGSPKHPLYIPSETNPIYYE